MSELEQIKARHHKGYRVGLVGLSVDDMDNAHLTLSQLNSDRATLISLLDELEAERDALQALVDAADPIIEAVAHIGVDFGYGAYELEEKHIHASRVLIDQKESE